MATSYIPRFQGPPIAPPPGLNSSTKRFTLGGLMNGEESIYRYIKANEALTAGDVVTAVAGGLFDSTILVDGAVTASTTNKVIHVDTIATAVAADYYAGYYVYQAASSGKGFSYKIVGHDAFTASGEADVHVDIAIGEAFADNAALYIYHPWLMEQIDGTTEATRGVVPANISSGQYGWIIVGGYVPAVKVGYSPSAAIVVDEALVPVGSGNAGAMQGMAGVTEADIMEASANRILALEAVGANTPGFIPGYIHGVL